MLAKRIIKCVGDRLRHADPERWDGVPITFKTNWNSENDNIDIKTCVLVHDALEREFNIDIDDRRLLLQSIQDCFHFIMSMHTAIWDKLDDSLKMQEWQEGVPYTFVTHAFIII